ncbi:hypothetical protein TCAL_16433 [Tigriopus californicus]|uniref:Uncharacterized protein n=1 Tax=Tigriopus californicus TaxID=6832 RepID=A0A553P0B7_TIGCA|nr:hypothetical protein TCAL_16433 [Tigriopus californicus]
MPVGDMCATLKFLLVSGICKKSGIPNIPPTICHNVRLRTAGFPSTKKSDHPADRGDRKIHTHDLDKSGDSCIEWPERRMHFCD